MRSYVVKLSMIAKLCIIFKVDGLPITALKVLFLMQLI